MRLVWQITKWIPGCWSTTQPPAPVSPPPLSLAYCCTVGMACVPLASRSSSTIQFLYTKCTCFIDQVHSDWRDSGTVRLPGQSVGQSSAERTFVSCCCLRLVFPTSIDTPEHSRTLVTNGISSSDLPTLMH